MATFTPAPIFTKSKLLQIQKVLCNAGGSLSLIALTGALYSTDMDTHDSGSDHLRRLLSLPGNKCLFHIVKDHKRDDFIVSVKTDAVLCSSYNPKQKTCTDGDACQAFHLCSHIVSDGCKKGKKCSWPHNLHDKHNAKVLQRHGLARLKDDHIMLILRLSWKDITVPDICQHFNRSTGCSKGKKCTFLHVCQFYVLGNCRYQQGCRLSHDIKSSQPMRVWGEFRIDAQSMSPGELLKMLQEKRKQALSSSEDSEEDSDQEDRVTSPGFLSLQKRERSGSSSGPNICIHYNKPTGCNRKQCEFLHVCRFFALGNCKFAKGCRLSHDRNTSHPNKRGTCSRIQLPSNDDSDEDEDSQSEGNDESIQALFPSLSSSPKPSDVEICEYNLRGKCHFGSKCYKMHSAHPFLWQSKANDKWKSLPDEASLSVEEAFCDVQQQKFKGDSGSIDFTAMIMKTMAKEFSVRRLEPPPVTASSMDWQIAMATTWQWYYQDKMSGWITYDPKVKVEEAYQNYKAGKESSKFEFETSQFYYVLDFSKMEQSNKSVGTVRQIRRRPCTLVTADILKRNLQMQTVLAVILPKNWEPRAIADSQNNFVMIHLQPNLHQEEYHRVADLFGQDMNASNIVKIERIQNNELWHDYTLKKERMKQECMKRQQGSEPKEKSLFHGTEHHVVEAICQQNFDFRISGSRVGAKWGKGSYFSTSAKYSHCYTTSDKQGHNSMFLARVLVGDYTQGNPSYGRPPLKDSKKLNGPMYDSCVDNTIDPRIYVIFDRVQVYPEYLITYKH